MPVSVGILKPSPQHHIATTLAVDGNGAARKPLETFPETVGRRQRARMQLWIAAGQPDRVGGTIGSLVGQRRERNDLRARKPPLPKA